MGKFFWGILSASVVSLTAGAFLGYFGKTYLDMKNTPETIHAVNETEEDYESEEPAEVPDIRNHYIADFEIIKQLPELPTGCEVTSLTMVLNYWGYEADKLEIARDYLEKSDLESVDDKLYGPDYRYVFVGDPEDDKSFGCFPPCLVSSAKKYLDDNGAKMSAVDLTGSSFDELFEYIDHDIPVIIWSTLGLAEPERILSWIVPDGEEVTWPTNEHCIVLSGYHRGKNTVRVHDPMNGIITLNMDAIRERYDQLGQNAVVIIKNK